MCDRHFALRKAIKEVFGETVFILHCRVHLARNMKSPCSANSDIVSKFWEMRYKRTKEDEDAFVSTLERLHAVRRSLCTTELLNSLPSFIQSQVDRVLRKEKFPALTALREFDQNNLVVDSAANGLVLLLFKGLLEVDPIESDLFALDNTNVIEGYFNGIKTPIQKRPVTLRDIFNAVDMAERTMLASGTPFRPKLPKALRDCILLVFTPDILNVLSLIWSSKHLVVDCDCLRLHRRKHSTSLRPF